MKVSVVIPVINESVHVRTAIERAWACGADEVVVVDGGSDDGTLEIAQSENCTLLHSARSGRAIQMNRGAKHATGDVLVFLHVDNWLSESSCQEIRKSLASGEFDYGAFRQRIEDPRWIYRWIEVGNRLRVQWQGLIYGDQAMFVRRSLFDQLGGFPEIALMEDFSFSRVLCGAGKPLILDGPTIVSARRWQATGPIRQTIRNWFLASVYRLGASPDWIEKFYRRHDR